MHKEVLLTYQAIIFRNNFHQGKEGPLVANQIMEIQYFKKRVLFDLA